MPNKNLYDETIVSSRENVKARYNLCVALRLALSIMIAKGLPKVVITILSLLIVIIFGAKSLRTDATWKTYKKTFGLWLAVLITNFVSPDKREFMASLVALDATSGLIVRDTLVKLDLIR
jgi:flagellar motor component MotA